MKLISKTSLMYGLINILFSSVYEEKIITVSVTSWLFWIVLHSLCGILTINLLLSCVAVYITVYIFESSIALFLWICCTWFYPWFSLLTGFILIFFRLLCLLHILSSSHTLLFICSFPCLLYILSSIYPFSGFTIFSKSN